MIDVSPALEVQLVALRELRKNLRSLRGMALLALTLLAGGGAMYLVLQGLQKTQAEELKNVPADMLPALRTQMLQEFLEKFLDFPPAAKHLANAPPIFLVLGFLTVLLTAGFCALAGFDSIAGDLQQRGIRFWTVRVRRASYVVGKFVGLWLVAALTILPLHLVVWIMAVVTKEVTIKEAVAWGPLMWAWWLPVAAAWASLVTLTSSLVRRPFFALFLSLFFAVVLWLGSKVLLLTHVPDLVFLAPGSCVELLASGDPPRVLEGMGILLAFTGTMLGLGIWRLTRSDV